MKNSFLAGMLLMLLVISACAPAVTNSELPAPNVFLRGIEAVGGVRYAATFIKPSDGIEMRNVQVEISLPARTILTGIGVPRQVGVAEVRENGATRTLAWNIPVVSASQQMDVLSFSVPVKISGPITFFMRWQDAAGVEHSEHFDDVPPVIEASESEAQRVVTESGYQAMGKSGVMVSAPVTEPPLTLSVRVLPVSFNPPAEFGAFWWCSLAEMSGVPTGESVDVVVPLRRPIAPFTKLALFQRNADGSWSLLPEAGTVTADGLSVAYAHPGGLVASGGEQELQPAQVELEEASDGTSNTIAFAEVPSQPDNVAPVEGNDGSSNTIIISEPTPEPPPVNDGNSNTIVFGEATPAPTTLAPTAEVEDGSSNTILIGEVTSTPALLPTTDVVDGSSNTILIGEVTATPALSPTTGAADGASNTIIIGEVTLTPTAAQSTNTPKPDLTLTFTPSPVLDVFTNTPEPGLTLTFTPSPTLDGFTNTPEAETPTIAATQTFAPSPTGEAAASEPDDRASPTPRPTQVIRIVTATPLAEITATAAATRTPAPTLALPIVAFNPPDYLESRYAQENSAIRVVIVQQKAGFWQCQSGGLICAPINRTPAY